VGTVVIHAGMPKTGSTSIQTWLRRHGQELRDIHDTSVVHVVRATDGGPSQFEAVPANRSINSISFLLQYHVARQQGATVQELAALADDFVDTLGRAASDGSVVVSAEGFASVFGAADEPFLRSLDRLAQTQPVRIAYYVRPQHSAIEARWRQWGFRTELSPSEWVTEQADQLRYADTRDATRALAPSVSFEVRPFRPDLLVCGNVVVDFVRTFLGIVEPAGADDLDENVGLSLDFANLLRGAPASLLNDPGVRVNAGGRQLKLGLLGRSWGLEETAAACESRAVVHEYAYAEFEPRNQALIDALQWPTDTFVPVPDGGDSQVRALTDLDALWQPPESASARAYLYAALSDLMSR
jgi:hypothetical protein